MKTILATAYAVNPYKGSEDGMGWNFVMQIARFHRVIAVTRINNQRHIDLYMAENPNELYERITFLYFDLPYWMRFWKKGSRGAMLYYILWQIGIVRFINKNQLQFDVVHNLNFHNDWTPSYLWKLGKPFVWGPIGHHPLIPKQFLDRYAFKYWLKDRLTWLIKIYFWKLSISLRQTKRRANHIMCMNAMVPEKLGLHQNYSITPSVATQDFGWNDGEERGPKFTVISAGRFVPLKGFDLSIKAFAAFLKMVSEEQKQNCELVLVGSGPEKNTLTKIISDNELSHQVKLISWIERDRLMDLMASSSAFLFPSHEGAGMVVAEALSFGLPVVCIKNEGPGQFVNQDSGIAVPSQGYDQTIQQLANALAALHQDEDRLRQMRNGARLRFMDLFHWDRRGEQLQKIYAAL